MAAVSNIVAGIRARLHERYGDNCLRLAHQHLLAASTVADVRKALARLGVRIADEEFATLEARGDAAALAADIVGKLSPRRHTVVGEAWRRLKAVCGMETACTIGAVHALFDPSRFQAVQTGHKTVDQYVQEMQELFSDESNPDGLVTQDEFVAFYGGVSMGIAQDVDFERHVLRAWNLDKPQVATRDELMATATTVPKSKAGREHPLYQPSSTAIGKNLDQAFDVPRSHNRAGAFTKHAPRPQPSSGLNTASTRSKVI
uniref:EF-hand domain-containing protein n=1 Tax=Neobodo designis TaxID=312471 RepID=A0A7S1PL58_NEODS|mmetsp:Transcript_11000/g.34021  ORF Transcript_11000/g.34021 Transcript_11000/m.34021 type:complete len:259 (+) Transcript_11000:38-814(+)